MTAKERINQIHKERYHDFNGRAYWKIKRLYKLMRYEFGDEKYLEFLEEQIKRFTQPTFSYRQDSPKVYINNNRLNP